MDCDVVVESVPSSGDQKKQQQQVQQQPQQLEKEGKADASSLAARAILAKQVAQLKGQLAQSQREKMEVRASGGRGNHTPACTA